MKLAFYHGPREGLFWRAVQWFVRGRTRGRYCHVDLIFSDGSSASSSISEGGIWIKADKPHDPAHWDIVAVDADEPAARAWFEAHRNAKFDTWGLLNFLLWPRKDDAERWFCSEACAAALGFPEPWRFCPSTLHAVVRRLK